MRTLVGPALAISSNIAGNTTLALAGHRKPSRPMPYPDGSYAAAQWRPNEAAQARWRELEVALKERELARRESISHARGWQRKRATHSC